MRLLAALDRYLLQLRADGRSVHTIEQYTRHLRLLDRWLAAEREGRTLATIDHEVLARFLVSDPARVRADGQPKKATATNTLRSSLRAFFSYVHAAGLARHNAAALVRRAKCACPPPRSLSEPDCKRLLTTLARGTSEVAVRDHLLFHLMLRTGIRVGSAVAIEKRDIDLPRGEVFLRTTKGDRPAMVLLDKAIVAHLRAFVHRRAEGPLFTGASGKPLTTRQVRRRLADWLGRAGVRHASPHALRHTFATNLYSRTEDILLVRDALRHRSLQSTMVYARGDDARLRAALQRRPTLFMASR